MDKLMNYRQIVQTVLQKQADFDNSVSLGPLETFAILDEKRDHYVLLRSGWQDTKRIRSVIVYVRLQKDKVWIEEDWLEDGVAPLLMEAGIPKEDIVLGFRHPTMRPYTEFAVA